MSWLFSSPWRYPLHSSTDIRAFRKHAPCLLVLCDHLQFYLATLLSLHCEIECTALHGLVIIVVTVLVMQARFMALDFEGDPGAEMTYLWKELHVDGWFTDCASTAVAWMHTQAWEHYIANEDGSSFWSLRLSAKGAAAARYGVTVFVFCLGLFMVVWAGYMMKKYGRYERMEREQGWSRQAQRGSMQPNFALQHLRDARANDQTNPHTT